MGLRYSMTEEKKFYSLEEVAETLSVDYQLVYKLVRGGELPAARLGRVYRVAKADLEAYLEQSKARVAGGRQVCAGCGKSYAAAESVREACTACGAALCADCWTRAGRRLCATCQAEQGK